MEEEEAFWPHDDHDDSNDATAIDAKRQRYERLGKVGEGAFGEVAAGWDRLTARAVAIKSVRLGNDFEKGKDWTKSAQSNDRARQGDGLF
jgi:hypothetical protein